MCYLFVHKPNDMSLSIIIPALNENKSLPATLACVNQLSPPAHEVIVVDGGSTDCTREIARSYGAQVVQTTRAGRARQMNAGARQATGEHLCFLHADTLVPADLVTVIRQTLSQPKIVLGGFTSRMQGPQKVRRLVSWLNYTKTYVLPLLHRPHRFWRDGLRLLFGDQVMFCRRRDFWAVDGFNPRLTIMEEADLCLRINRLGRITQLSRKVFSSDRRVAHWGFAKAFCIWVSICALWTLGVPDQQLKQLYEDLR